MSVRSKCGSSSCVSNALFLNLTTTMFAPGWPPHAFVLLFSITSPSTFRDRRRSTRHFSYVVRIISVRIGCPPRFGLSAEQTTQNAHGNRGRNDPQHRSLGVRDESHRHYRHSTKQHRAPSPTCHVTSPLNRPFAETVAPRDGHDSEGILHSQIDLVHIIQLPEARLSRCLYETNAQGDLAAVGRAVRDLWHTHNGQVVERIRKPRYLRSRGQRNRQANRDEVSPLRQPPSKPTPRTHPPEQ